MRIIHSYDLLLITAGPPLSLRSTRTAYFSRDADAYHVHIGCPRKELLCSLANSRLVIHKSPSLVCLLLDKQYTGHQSYGRRISTPMSNRSEAIVAYFTSITHCQRDEALQFLERNHWKLDQSLNLFFEPDHNRQSLTSHGRRIDAPLPSRSSPETIIIPSMIAFQR